MRLRFALPALLGLGALVTSCGSDDASSDGSSDDITVFAASSLTDAFGQIGEAFTAANPGLDITFNFAGSSDLATQIEQGGPADVFASADDKNMALVVDAGQAAGDPTVFARNTFEIIVEPGNPKGITGPADLTDPDLVVVLCDEVVPCGSGAATVLDNAGVDVTPKSFEDKVKGVVTKVTAGEADAGIVYVTDVTAAADSASGVEIPAEVNAVASYPIVVTEDAADAETAQAFVEFVAGPTGQAILAENGFLAP